MNDSNARANALLRSDDDAPPDVPGGVEGAPKSARAPLTPLTLADPATTNDTLKRLWGPVLMKVASVAAGMVGLACVGLVATWGKTASGDPASALAQAGTLLDGMWLAPTAGDEAPIVSARALTAEAPTVLTADTSPPASTTPPASSSSSTQPAPDRPPPDQAAPGVTHDGKVILNTASVDDLQRLPGIGQKRAEKIIELRTRLGGFKKPTDLLRIRGIGVKSLKRMLPHLVLDPPEVQTAPAPSGAPSTTPSG